ncbi:MAG: type IV pilus twitching motility protein PilT [Gemmatimonadaceae bacterium]
MERIIRLAVERGASDLHIKAGDVFRARIDGKLVPLSKQVLTPEQTKAIAMRLLARDDERKRIDEIRDYDCSYSISGLGRFRVSILRQRSSFMIVMRVIPVSVPTFDELSLPPVLSRITQAERGMVLVTGVTGSGKTSTIAALVNHMNQTMTKHILTLENPVEYLHRDKGCSITQREIGVDTESFKSGLRSALRQDPDVIMIGEMRDGETADTAMKAAETGHLLISTLHTPDAQTTINRIIAMFPPEEQGVARIRLAESLHSVVSQRLLPRADGKGRVVACEIMLVTPLVRDLILDQAKTPEILECIADGRDQYGMQTFDQHLMELVNAGQVTFEVACAAATKPADFELQMRLATGRPSHSTARPSANGHQNRGDGAGDLGDGQVPSPPPLALDSDMTRLFGK